MKVVSSIFLFFVRETLLCQRYLSAQKGSWNVHAPGCGRPCKEGYNKGQNSYGIDGGCPEHCGPSGRCCRADGHKSNMCNLTDVPKEFFKSNIHYCVNPRFPRATNNASFRSRSNPSQIQNPLDEYTGWNYANDLWIKYGPVSDAVCLQFKQRRSFRVSPTFTTCELAAMACSKYPECNIIVKYERPGEAPQFDIGDTRAESCPVFAEQSTKVQVKRVKIQNYGGDSDVCEGLSWTNGLVSKAGDADFHVRSTEIRNPAKIRAVLATSRQSPPHAYWEPPTKRVWGRKRRSLNEYGCAHFGGECSDRKGQMCSQLFDRLEPAQLACAISSDCTHVAKQGTTYQIWSSKGVSCTEDAEPIELFERESTSSNKTFTNILTVVGHGLLPESVVSQVAVFDRESKITRHFIPDHLDLQAATTLVFHDEGYHVTILDKICLIDPNEEHEILTENSVSMLYYHEALEEGSMTKRNKNVSLREVDRSLIPDFIISHCGSRLLVQSEVTSDNDKNQFANSTLAYDDYMQLSSPPIESMFHKNRLRRSIKECPDKNCNGNSVLISCFPDWTTLQWDRIPNLEKVYIQNTMISRWEHISVVGYWCLPCCWGEGAAAMPNCEDLRTPDDIYMHYKKCGRCGDGHGWNPNKFGGSAIDQNSDRLEVFAK